MMKIKTLCQEGVSRCCRFPGKRGMFKGWVRVVQVLGKEDAEKVD